jgi:uncharacterized protein (DUF2147 family)
MNALLRLLPCALLFTCFTGLQAQVTGKWITFGDQDGKEKAIIEIYEENGKLAGKVVKLLPDAVIRKCEKCSGDMKNRPIEGMVILHGLTKTSQGGTDGKIIDPSSGKTYSCFVELEKSDTLKVRGYIGMPTLGRTQYWQRLKV